MPYEVARAYDENKNLVPLYVLYDGEVPEVSPGFDFSLASINSTTFNLFVTNTSTNPVGGTVTISSSVDGADSGETGTFTLYNNSDFTISVALSALMSNGDKTSFYDITVTGTNPIITPSHQSSVYNVEFPELRIAAYMYSVTLNIQRIRS